jgi:hypothetical protein
MNRKCCAAAVMAAALISSPAAAQDPPLILTPATPHLWDISGDIGWFSSRRSDIRPTWDEWYDVPAASAAVGRYWTPHLRSELRVAVSGEGRTYRTEQIPVPGQAFPAVRVHEHYVKTAAAGVGVYHQFFRNQWFHPFAGGGVDVERQSNRVVSPELRIPARSGAPPLFVPSFLGTRTTTYAARPFVSTGFKWYVHERGFIRSDVKVSLGRNSNPQTTWSAGIGVDL